MKSIESQAASPASGNSSSGVQIKGSPEPAGVWDAQYRAGAWDYLESDDELAHYLAICNLYQRHLRDRTVLDLGCGTGTLYRHLVERSGMDPSRYTGTDLSEAALRLAADRHPEARFERCDYSTDPISERFGCVVFNETLYCFEDPVRILQKSLQENLQDGGLLIVSIYGDHHEALWQAIAACCATVDEQIVENDRQVRWKIRALKPLS